MACRLIGHSWDAASLTASHNQREAGFPVVTIPYILIMLALSLVAVDLGHPNDVEQDPISVSISFVLRKGPLTETSPQQVARE